MYLPLFFFFSLSLLNISLFLIKYMLLRIGSCWEPDTILDPHWSPAANHRSQQRGFILDFGRAITIARKPHRWYIQQVPKPSPTALLILPARRQDEQTPTKVPAHQQAHAASSVARRLHLRCSGLQPPSQGLGCSLCPMVISVSSACSFMPKLLDTSA